MNIFFVTSSMNMGGAERVAATLCNAWAAQGHKVILVPTFSQASESFYELAKNIELIYLSEIIPVQKKTILNYGKRLLALRRLIQRKQPDVVISFLSNVNVAAILASRGLKIPVICCERRNPAQSIGRIWDVLCRKSYPHANALLVQTEAVIKTMQKRHPHVRCIQAIANPISNTIVPIKKSWPVRQQKTLMSLSRLVSEKQIDQMILIFHKLASVHSDWNLHIYGDGPLRHELQELIRSLNLEERVLLKGAISNPWETLVHEADIFVMCSKYEGFPNALLEAMGAGMPCVTYDFPYGAREMSNHGRHALLIPLNNTQEFEYQLNELMSNEPFRKQLGTQAKEFVLNQYHIDTILECWNKLFRQLGITVS